MALLVMFSVQSPAVQSDSWLKKIWVVCKHDDTLSFCVSPSLQMNHLVIVSSVRKN